MTDMALCCADALFSIAEESGREKEFRESLFQIDDIFKSEKEYVKILSDPNIDISDRLKCIDDAFSGRIPDEETAFLKILCKKRLLNIFSDCVKEFEKMYSEKAGELNVKVVGACEMTDEEKRKLEKTLEKRFSCKIKASYSVDESLIGGFVVYAGDKIIDASIKNKLKQIKEMRDK